MTTLTYSELETLVDACVRPIRTGTIIEYLSVLGWQKSDTTKTLVAVTSQNYYETIREITKPLSTGDIVYTQGMGFYLVTDTHPAQSPDGLHFRGMKVEFDDNGDYRINADVRSKVLNNNMTLFIKKSRFDMTMVENCSYGRAEAYNRISEYNTQLARLRG